MRGWTRTFISLRWHIKADISREKGLDGGGGRSLKKTKVQTGPKGVAWGLFNDEKMNKTLYFLHTSAADACCGHH